MLVLGIESSCDETAAAIVDGEGRVRSDVVQSQVALHAAYGDVSLCVYPFAACPCTTSGRTSIDPIAADGMRAAIDVASSRSAASIR